jgi:hypothetical protein
MLMKDMQGEDPPSVVMTRDTASNDGGQNNDVTYANLSEQPRSCPSEHPLEQPSGKSTSNPLGTMDERNEKDMQGEDQSSVVMMRDATSNDGGGNSNVTYANLSEQPCWNPSENPSEQPSSKSSLNSLGTMDERNKKDMQGEDQLSIVMMRDAALNDGRGDNDITHANPLERPRLNPSENLVEQPSGKSSSNPSRTMDERDEKDVQGEDPSSVVMTRDAASNDGGGEQ